jgi:hypothetical protein
MNYTTLALALQALFLSPSLGGGSVHTKLAITTFCHPKTGSFTNCHWKSSVKPKNLLIFPLLSCSDTIPFPTETGRRISVVVIFLFMFVSSWLVCRLVGMNYTTLALALQAFFAGE